MRLPRRSKVILLEGKLTKLRHFLVPRSPRRAHDEQNELRYLRRTKNCPPSSRSVCHQNRPWMTVQKRGASYSPSRSDDQVKRCSMQQNSVLPSQNRPDHRDGRSEERRVGKE